MPYFTGGHGKRLLVWSHSTGTLENAPLTFHCWPLVITIIFSNTILWPISICFNFSREANSTGVSSDVVYHSLTRNFTLFNFWITRVANIFLTIKWSLNAEILLIRIFSAWDNFHSFLCSILLHTWHTWWRPSLIFFLNVLQTSRVGIVRCVCSHLCDDRIYFFGQLCNNVSHFAIE